MTTKRPQPPPTQTPDPFRPVTPPPPPRQSTDVRTAADLRRELTQAAAERQRLSDRIDTQQKQIDRLRKQVRHLLARLHDDC